MTDAARWPDNHSRQPLGSGSGLGFGGAVRMRGPMWRKFRNRVLRWSEISGSIWWKELIRTAVAFGRMSPILWSRMSKGDSEFSGEIITPSGKSELRMDENPGRKSRVWSLL
ncbi:hypothetical protein TorRG33x02_062880, partial [Trema orientale]